MSARPWNQQISANYEHAEAVSMMRAGPNAMIGQVVFWETPSTGRVTCRGSGVTLLPATNYAKQWFPRHFGGSGLVDRPTQLEGLSPTVKGFLSLAKYSPCNDAGEFRFDHLKTGDYILHTSIEWPPGSKMTGQTFYAVVHVAEGRDTQVVVSSPYRLPNATFPPPTVEFGIPYRGSR